MAKVVNPKEEWFWDEEIVDSYESWYEGKGRRADRLEKAVLSLLMRDFGPVESLVEVGCGTTHFTRYFESLGLECKGYDLSPKMLNVAHKLWDGELIRGDSAHLPFRDNSFDLVAYVTCLEFMPRPLQVLKEGARVARRGLVVGLMNRYGVSTIRRKIQVRFGKNPFYKHAHFFSLKEIRSLLREAVGREPNMDWRATILPRLLGDRITKVPIGDFLGIAVKLNKEENPSSYGHEATPRPLPGL